MGNDPYVHPGTELLINKLNIHNETDLKLAEAALTSKRLAELYQHPIKGNFDLQHLQAIHNHIFQDVYEWSGKIRSVNIEKSTLFCLVPNIHSYQQFIFNDLKKENFLKEDDIDQFSKRAAYYLGEINMLHPFREGNGRTQREFMRELALHAGYELDLSTIPSRKMIEASIESANINNNEFEKIIRENIKPIELVNHKELHNPLLELSQIPAVKDLPNSPPAKILFAAYAKEALAENGQVWSEKTTQSIADKMLRNGIATQRVRNTLKYSPEPIKNISLFVKELSKDPEIKALQKSKGLKI